MLRTDAPSVPRGGWLEQSHTAPGARRRVQLLLKALRGLRRLRGADLSPISGDNWERHLRSTWPIHPETLPRTIAEISAFQVRVGAMAVPSRSQRWRAPRRLSCFQHNDAVVL